MIHLDGKFFAGLICFIFFCVVLQFVEVPDIVGVLGTLWGKWREQAREAQVVSA